MKRTLILSCLVVVASNAMALDFVSSRNLFPEQAWVDWGVLGATGTVINDPIPVATSGDPINMIVDGPGTSMQRLDQNNGWNGNFTPGDQLLFTNFVDGKVRMDFSKSLSDFGTQVQRNDYGDYTATIEAFDGTNTSLGSFTVNGNANGSADGSAVFVGVHSAASDILHVELTVSNGEGWAMNRLSMGCCNTNPVPEPMTMGVIGLGSLLTLRRKAKKA